MMENELQINLEKIGNCVIQHLSSSLSHRENVDNDRICCIPVAPL